MEPSLFDYNREDKYTLTEFFWKFKDKLPLLVTVIEGDYNPTRWGDLGIGQVIRYSKSYTEKRVLARPPDFDEQQRFLSIPLDAMYSYHIVKGKDKVGTAQSLPDILKTHDLPVLIQFSDAPNLPYLVKNDDETMKILLVTHEYENHYLVGNMIESDEGVIDSSTIVNNISKRITVSPILGFSDDNQENFQEYLRSLDKFIGNEVNMKDYDISIKTFDVMNEEIKRIVDMAEVNDNDIYDELCPALPERGNRPPPIPKRKPKLDETHHPEDDHKEKQYSPHQKHSSFHWHSHKSKFSSAIQGARAKIKSVTRHHRSTNAETRHSAEYVKTAIRQSDSHCYSSLDFDKNSHISGLSVKEVGEVLNNLNLSEYVDKFCQNQVDGVLLHEMDMNMLTDDFSFTETEAEILMKFVSDGYTCENDFQD